MPYSMGKKGRCNVMDTSPAVRRAFPNLKDSKAIVANSPRLSRLVMIKTAFRPAGDNRITSNCTATWARSMVVCAKANEITTAPRKPTTSYVPRIGFLKSRKTTSQHVNNIIPTMAQPAIQLRIQDSRPTNLTKLDIYFPFTKKARMPRPLVGELHS